MMNKTLRQNFILATRASLVVRVGWNKGLECISLRFELWHAYDINNKVIVGVNGALGCMPNKKKKEIYLNVNCLLIRCVMYTLLCDMVFSFDT